MSPLIAYPILNDQCETHTHTYATLKGPSRLYFYICLYVQGNSNCIYKKHIHTTTLKNPAGCAYISVFIYNVTVTIKDPEAMNLRGNVRLR